MGFRRGLSTTGVIIARRLRPSYYCHIHQDNRDEPVQSPLDKSQFVAAKYLSQAAYNKSNMIGSRFWGGPYPSFAASARLSSPYSRYMSSSSGDIFGEVITEITGAVASQVPAISEVAVAVAVAAGDSAYPVAAIQYLIDGVHSFTGLNWWASIALTTILIRGATVPLQIYQLRFWSRLNLLSLQLEELNEKSNSSWIKDAEAKRLHTQRVLEFLIDYGVTPFAPFKELLIRVPVFISFCLAILNMVDKVPSFHTGGTLWFTDLTTPDSYYILPLVTALTIWISIEFHQEGSFLQPDAATRKYLLRIIAVMTSPLMICLPQALFSYWLTSKIFSLCYGLVIMQPGVKRYFNIPEVTVQPPPAKQTSPLPQGKNKC